MDVLWATKSEDVGLIVHTISFQDFQPMWYDPSTSQTDRHTDRQTDDMRSQDRALHYSAVHGKKSNIKYELSNLKLLQAFLPPTWVSQNGYLNQSIIYGLVSDTTIVRMGLHHPRDPGINSSRGREDRVPQKLKQFCLMHIRFWHLFKVVWIQDLGESAH